MDVISWLREIESLRRSDMDFSASYWFDWGSTDGPLFLFAANFWQQLESIFHLN